jgi:hypothetical protein
MKSDDLHDLLSAWLGVSAGPERCEELLARIRQDKEFRRAFVAEIRMLGMLKAVQSSESRWLRLEDSLGWSAEEMPAGDHFEDEVVSRLPELPAGRPTLRPKSKSKLNLRLKGIVIWGAVAAAAALVLLSVGLALRSGPRGGREVTPRTIASAPTSAKPYPKIPATSGLAVVVKLDGVRWEVDDEPHPAPGDVLAAGRLRLRSGRATLTFLSGVVLIVEGPADLDLVSADRVFCRHGRLRSRVPEGAEGFVVSAPRSAVLDVGTEFEYDIAADGKARVMVHEGEAEGAVLSASGVPQHTLRMRKNQAFEINPGSGLISGLANPKGAIAPTDLKAPSLVLDPAYPGAVLALRPWSYWRFESMIDGAIPSEVPGRPPLHAHGPIRVAGTPGDNHYAVFKAGETGQCLLMDGRYEPSPSPGYAVELWFLPEAIRHAALAGLFVPGDDELHVKHLLFTEMTALTRQTLHPPGSVRFLHRWPPESDGGSNLYSRQHYVPYRWHHLVVQISGDRMELFLDGEPTDSMPIRPGHSTVPCQFLLGRLTTVPIHAWWTSRPFAGLMDEVALYDRPLSAEEIRDHHRLATQRVVPE